MNPYFYNTFLFLKCIQTCSMYPYQWTAWIILLQMMVVLVDKLLKTQIVEPSAVANWLFSSEMQPEFTKYAGFMLSLCFTIVIY